MRVRFFSPCIFCTVIAVLALHCTGVAHAIIPGPQLLTSAGVSVPQTPNFFTDGWDLGFSGGLGLSLGLGSSVRVIGGFDFHFFDPDDSNLLEGNSGVTISDGAQITVVNLSASARFYLVQLPFSPIKPYLIGGAGYFRFDVSEPKTNGGELQLPIASDVQNVLGIHGGVGVEISNIFVEALYQAGKLDGETLAFTPIRVGLAFGIGPGR